MVLIEMNSIPDLSTVDDMDDIDIQRYADKRGFNLQLIAAEAGHVGAMKALINRGFEIDCEVEGHSPAELAFANKHFDVVLNLLQANSKFPSNFKADEDQAPIELKQFVELSTSLHESIKDGDDAKVMEIIEEKSGLQYFYSVENKSAVMVAIENKKFDIYKTLIEHKIYISPHEDIDILMKSLTRLDRRKLRDLHSSLSTSILSEPMTTIMQNCFVGPDVPDREENLNFIHSAFFFLLQIPLVAIILNIVAASRHFRIVFDFKRESVSYADPTAEPYTNGLFYVSGKIYIGAKNMLDARRKFEVFAVIAHELCHYAMFLVFNNNAKPYHKGKVLLENIFNEITEECKNVESDEIVQSVFQCYPPSMHHAELIARAPQLLALHHNDQEALEEKKREFPSLLGYYEKDCVPEMKKALPKIKAKNLSETQKKVLRQRKIIYIISVIFGIFVALSIPLGLWLYSPSYSWNKLSEEQKDMVENSIVTYRDTDTKMINLFANDSIVYSELFSEQIGDVFEGDTRKISDAIETFYSQHIYLEWSNMTERWRNKLLSCQVNFQGQIIEMGQIFSNKSAAFNSLKAPQVRDLIRGLQLNISSKIDPKSKFFQERFFIHEITNLVYTDCENSWQSINNNDCKKIKNFDEIVNELLETKVFLLSSSAGEGKSTTFRHFWFMLKEKFPSKWVEYVDLKKHVHAYKIGNRSDLNTPNKIVNFLTENLLNLNALESPIFTDLFNSNNVILLWDGIDEISPLYGDFLLKLVTKIKNLTHNLQCVATRPLYSKKFGLNLNVVSYKLVPLNKQKQQEFLLKNIAVDHFNLDISRLNFTQNFTLNNSQMMNATEMAKFTEILKRGENVLKMIETSKLDVLTSPMLIRMIAEIIVDDDVLNETNLNVYKIYELFMDKTINNTKYKGEVLGRFFDGNARKTGVMRMHQAYFLKSLAEVWYKGLDYDLSELKILKVASKISAEEISRYGIFIATSDQEVDYIHKTFHEFFFAQYFIDNMDEFDGNKDETKFRIYLLNSLWFDPALDVVKRFLLCYMEVEEELPPFLQFLRDSKSKKELFENKTAFLNIFDFLDLAVFFDDRYGVPLSSITFEFEWFFPMHLKNSELVTNWYEYVNVIGKSFFHKIFKLKSRNNYEMSVLFHHAQDSEVNMRNMLIQFNDTFGPADTISQLESENFYKANLIMTLVSNKQDIKSIIDFIRSIASNDFWKQNLLKENLQSLTMLQYSIQDENTFFFIKDLYIEFLSKKQVQMVMLKVEKNSLPFIALVIQRFSLNATLALSQFLYDLFDDEKVKLRDSLTHRDSHGDTFFNEIFYESTMLYQQNIKIFLDLLQKTFEESEIEQFKILQAEVKENKMDLRNWEMAINNFRNQTWKSGDFRILMGKWDAIRNMLGDKEFKKLLTTTEYNEDNETLLYKIIEINSDKKQLEQFLSKLKEILDKDDLKVLLSTANKNGYSPLMSAAFSVSENIIKSFWGFITNNLSTNEQVQLLLAVDYQNDTVLHNSARSYNYHNDILIFVKDIYKELISEEIIRNLITKNKNFSDGYVFINDIIELLSVEACKDFANYLEELFRDCKHDLISLLGKTKLNGDLMLETIISDDNYLQRKIFFDLYKKLLNHPEN